MSLPNKVFELRKRLNLSQSAFAKKIGVSQGTIGDIERGRIRISKNVQSKIFDKIDIEIGYFDSESESKKSDLKQGIETGYNQGFTLKSSLVNLYIDENSPENSSTKRVDASNISFDEVVNLIKQKGGEIVFLNMPQSTRDKLDQLFEEQCFITEKAILHLQRKNKEFADFKATMEAIKSFNKNFYMLGSELIDMLFNSNDIARENLTKSLAETKESILKTFEPIKEFTPIYNSLAKAMTDFAIKAKSIPEQVSNISKREIDEFLELNS